MSGSGASSAAVARSGALAPRSPRARAPRRAAPRSRPRPRRPEPSRANRRSGPARQGIRSFPNLYRTPAEALPRALPTPNRARPTVGAVESNGGHGEQKARTHDLRSQSGSRPIAGTVAATKSIHLGLRAHPRRRPVRLVARSGAKALDRAEIALTEGAEAAAAEAPAAAREDPGRIRPPARAAPTSRRPPSTAGRLRPAGADHPSRPPRRRRHESTRSEHGSRSTEHGGGASMTSHTARLYALVGAVLVFFVAWAAIAAHPWQKQSAAPQDPRLAALQAREQRLRAEVARRQADRRQALGRLPGAARPAQAGDRSRSRPRTRRHAPPRSHRRRPAPACARAAPAPPHPPSASSRSLR